MAKPHNAVGTVDFASSGQDLCGHLFCCSSSRWPATLAALHGTSRRRSCSWTPSRTELLPPLLEDSLPAKPSSTPTRELPPTGASPTSARSVTDHCNFVCAVCKDLIQTVVILGHPIFICTMYRTKLMGIISSEYFLCVGKPAVIFTN